MAVSLVVVLVVEVHDFVVVDPEGEAPVAGDVQAFEATALADAKAKPFLDGQQVVKIVVVPDKLVHIVVR